MLEDVRGNRCFQLGPSLSHTSPDKALILSSRNVLLCSFDILNVLMATEGYLVTVLRITEGPGTYPELRIATALLTS